MSYTAAIDQLNSMVPELHTRSGQSKRKFSLDELRVLLAELGNPQRRFPSVLIAGTNGKGSTAATLASILTVSGVRTGLYTSPHLERANERIRVDRVEIDDDLFAALYFRVQDVAQKLVEAERLPQQPSYFEVLTALGFLYFAQVGVEIAVLEVGMGGRLDATNVVDPLVSVITDISLDHTEWLGSTIAAITREKAGILRPEGTMVALSQHCEANQILDEVTARLEVRTVNAAAYLPPLGAGAVGPYWIEIQRTPVKVDSPLVGAHQHRNLALAVAAAVELADRHRFPVTPATIAAGIRETRWPGRLERFQSQGVEWILDVAHNPAGVWALRTGLSAMQAEAGEEQRPGTLIFSCLRDKPVAEMAQILFPLFERVIVTPINSPRAASLNDLLAAAEAAGTRAVAAESVREALQVAESLGVGPIVVSGSVFLVGEARSLLLKETGART